MNLSTTRSTTTNKNGSKVAVGRTTIGEMMMMKSSTKSRLLEPIHEEGGNCGGGQQHHESSSSSRIIISNEKDKDKKEENRSTDPFLACRLGDLDLVKRLVTKENCNERETTGRRSSCLHFAAGFGRRDVCDYLLNECAADPSVKDEGGLEPIHNASSFGHCDVIELLIERGANVNAADRWQWTPLHESCTRSKLDVAALLIRRGADVTRKNCDCKSPLDLCPEGSDLRALLTGEYRKSEFLEAAKKGDEKTLLQLLTPLNVNAQATDGRKSTALHLASGYNRIQIVKILLKNGANVHSRDKGGLIALHNACSYGHYDVAKLLLEHGTDPNCTDMWSFTPLHEAIMKNRGQVCSLLLSYKADPYARNCYDKTPFDLAFELNKDLFDKLLLDYYGYSLQDAIRNNDCFKAKRILNHDLGRVKNEMMKLNINSTTAVENNGDDDNSKTAAFKFNLVAFTDCENINTPLHVAAQIKEVGKKPEILDYLLRREANLFERNRDGQLALHCAVLSENQLNVDLLLTAMKNEQMRRTSEESSPSRKTAINRAWLSEMIDCKGESPLHYSARLNNLPISLLLISFGFDLSLKSTSECYPHDLCTDPDIRTVLYEKFLVMEQSMSRNMDVQLLLEACKSGDLDVVERILTNEPTLVNCSDTEGRLSTPLHFAAGYNRVDVCKLLISRFRANVHACDRASLQPLHNAASYGHLKVVCLLIKSGADINAQDIYQYTPLHEATLKRKHDVCRVLMKNGADASLRTREGHSSLDLALQSGDEDLIDILRGDEAFLDACKRGDLAKVKKLLVADKDYVCCRDTSGRNSLPLHLAAGYNHLALAECLLEFGADTTARDSGGLVPLHNAASYGHVEMAALLLKNNPAMINLTDNWGFNALHEASQKGRTQICALLLEHGIDINMRNQDNQTALDLATADDVRALLVSAMPTSTRKTTSLSRPLSIEPSSSSSRQANAIGSDKIRSETAAGTSSTTTTTVPPPVNIEDRNNKSSKEQQRVNNENNETGDGCVDLDSEQKRSRDSTSEMSVREFLAKLKLGDGGEESNDVDFYASLFEKEKICMEVLCDMKHEDLKEIGIDAYGVRHKIIKGVDKYYKSVKDPFYDAPTNGVSLIVELEPGTYEYEMVRNETLSSIRIHKDDYDENNVLIGRTYEIVKIEKIKNRKMWTRFEHRRREIQEENSGHENERLLFHGSPYWQSIVERGFDERHASIQGMFGAGIYFAENSSKSNQYIYGLGGGSGCPTHRSKNCCVCIRQLLLCRVCLGKSFCLMSANRLAHAPPGHHSVCGRPSLGGLVYPEYVVYRGEQAYPEYIISYKLVEKA